MKDQNAVMNDILKEMRKYGGLGLEELKLIHSLIKEIIDFDREHRHRSTVAVEVLLEKAILELKLRNYQSY